MKETFPCVWLNLHGRSTHTNLISILTISVPDPRPVIRSSAPPPVTSHTVMHHS